MTRVTNQADMSAQHTDLEVAGYSTKLHEFGDGPPLLLLHGGWAGAKAHFQSVWMSLAGSFRVVAPELPGIVEGTPLGSYTEYAEWLVHVLAKLKTGPVTCIGNSLGANIGRCLAVAHPELVKRLVLVDGGRVEHDPFTRLLVALPGGIRLLRRMGRQTSFSEATLARAFANPTSAPVEVRESLVQSKCERFDGMMRLFLVGAPGCGLPRVPTLVIWGKQDRLIGWTARDGERFARTIPGARFHVIEGAGHLPQIEQPELFVEAVRNFCGLE